MVLGLPIAAGSCSGSGSGDDATTSPETGVKDGGTDLDSGTVEAEAGDPDGEIDADDSGPVVCQGLDTSTAQPLTGCAWSGYRGYPTYINGTSDSDIWVTSESGPVMHYDGQAWETYELHHRTYSHGLVFGPDSVLLGIGHQLGYYDGSEWYTLDLGVNGSAFRLWGTSPCNMWATGGLDFWLHNDGTGWRKIDDPFDWGYHMWGTAADDMFLIGSEVVGVDGMPVPAGRIAHWDGMEWIELWREEYRDIKGIWGTASDDVFAVGGRDPSPPLVLHYDGQTWTETPTISTSEATT